MIHDASHSYTYDAENRLISVNGGSTASYVYDAEGRRVQKTAGGAQTNYIYDLAGQVITEVSPSTWLNVYLRLNGSLFAQYTVGAPRTQFIHTDHLGSTRLLTALDQSVYDSMDYLPFGEQIAGSSATSHKFTSKERDPESGLDEFGARYYSSALGRFTIPDWAASATAVPYADFGNPQSLNLYAYVGNNPLTLTDPDGHCCEDAMEFGKDLVGSPSPVAKIIGVVILAGAVVATVATNPGARQDIENAVKEVQPYTIVEPTGTRCSTP
jgi:RHS repeat-associated protein